MFTLSDIRDIAVQIEKNGEEAYRNAAKVAKDPEVAAMLEWMANEERCHAIWFEALPSNRPLSDEQKEMEAMGRSLLQEMVKGNNFLLPQSELEQIQTVTEVISRSQEFERDTILFYEFIMGLLDDQETMQQLEKIIEEERNHLHRLELVAKKVPGVSRTRCPADPG
jgi:rubrerythrin